MAAQQPLQSSTARAEQPERPLDGSRRSPEFTFRGPWFSAAEAAAYVPCKTVKAWYEWRRRHGIVPRANGSVAKADLDRVLRRRKVRRVMAAASLANLRRGA